MDGRTSATQRRWMNALGTSRRAGGAEAWIAVAIVIAITWVSWTPQSFSPAPGLDPSWQAGLAMALHQNLAFGQRVAFTYGPLGFLTGQSNWFGALVPWAFIYVLIQRLAVSAALFLAARRNFGQTWWGTTAAAVFAALLASLVPGPVQTAVVMIIACWALRARLQGRAAYLLAVGLAVVSAVELMNKISVGTTVLLMSAVTLVALPQRRWSIVLTGLGTGIVAFVALWLAIGQPIGAIPHYVRAAIQVSGGYGPAMSTDAPLTDWTYTLFFLFLGAGLWAAWETTAGNGLRQRIGLMVVWLVFWFFGFKEAVVRLHFDLFTQSLLIGWIGFSASPGTRRRDAWFRTVAGAGALVVVLLALHATSLTRPLRPASDVSQAIKNVNTAFSPVLRGRAREGGRHSIESTDQIDGPTLAAVAGHTVAVFPNEAAAAWAYRLHWDPIPVFQSYVAYTPYLDKLDARFLASDRAPERILMSASSTTPAQSIDQRILAYDEPATTREMLCRYRVIHTSPHWAVLARRPVSRCASVSRLLFTLHVRWGQSIPVPPPPTSHSIVYARISGSAVTGAEALWSFLFKPGRRYLIVNGQFFRFVSASEGDGLVLRSSSGYDLPKGFTMIPQALELGVGKIGQRLTGQPITIRFYAETFTGS